MGSQGFQRPSAVPTAGPVFDSVPTVPAVTSFEQFRYIKINILLKFVENGDNTEMYFFAGRLKLEVPGAGNV